MHIAMWTCARSRSTLLLRSFQQHNRCITFDEPLYAPYLMSTDSEHPHKDEIVSHHETDYDAVISQITDKLPPGIDFSFQKHTANNIPQDRDLSWLMDLKSFFLIRSPKEIILSRQAIYKSNKNFSLHEIGLKDLYNLFVQIRDLTGETPVVLDSADLLKNPRRVLQRLSDLLGFAFSESMLSWPPGLRETDPVWAKSWYRTLLESSTFLPPVARDQALPSHLQAIHLACLPYYDELYQHRIQ